MIGTILTPPCSCSLIGSGRRRHDDPPLPLLLPMQRLWPLLPQPGHHPLPLRRHPPRPCRPPLHHRCARPLHSPPRLTPALRRSRCLHRSRRHPLLAPLRTSTRLPPLSTGS